jgi:hypothetical protein
MSSANKVAVDSFITQCSGQMVPINKALSYFSAIPMSEADLRRWLYEPVAAIPPKVGNVLPKLRIVLVPYLESDAEKAGKKSSPSPSKNSRKAEPVKMVSFRQPSGPRRLVAYHIDHDGQTFLFMAVKNQELADYHYSFYSSLAVLISRRIEAKARARFNELVRGELLNESNGEVDETSWQLKDEVIRRHTNLKGNSKVLENYFRQALEDTMTLYLHGLCCDIDIESGPRQLSSRDLRRRLVLLRELLPPPKGFALFPEEL